MGEIVLRPTLDRIWLDPACVTECEHADGRYWHSENPGACEDCGMEPEEFVRVVKP